MRHLSLSLAMLVVACSDPPAPATPPARTPPQPAVHPERRQPDLSFAWRAADARTPAPLRAALLAEDPARRAAAVSGLARLHDVSVLPDLRDALRDPEPAVRSAASLGIGALERRASPDAVDALVGSLAAEALPARRAETLWDLGRTGAEAALPPLRDALTADEPLLREGACRGLGALVLAETTLPPDLLVAAAQRGAGDSSVAVRVACLHVVVRTPADPQRNDVLLPSLVAAARDADPGVRAMAFRALGRWRLSDPTDVLAPGTLDADPVAATEAFRALSKRTSGAPALVASLEGALQDLLPNVRPQRVPVLLAALDAASALSTEPVVLEGALRIHERLGRATPGRATGLLHCAAAKLVDLARNWPTKLETCGLGQVSPTERDALEAEVLAHGTGAEAERIVALRRLLGRGDARVAQAVLAACAALTSPAARALVLEHLRHADPGVVTSALDALTEWAKRPSPVSAGSIQLVDVRLDAPDTGPPEPDTRAPMRAALALLRRTDEVEGLQSWLHAAEALHDTALLEDARPLAHHSIGTLRDETRRVLEAADLSVPDAPPDDVPNPIEAASLLEGPTHATLETTQGDIELELLVAEAPTTTARFVALAQRGYFDGLRFHRVIPGFVAQGGDPRGDGYGGPGWTQRCEDNRVRYEPGTVGMALAGRDTGGSQFFVTTAAQPHLDGRYTAFARVLRGLDVAVAMLPGDTLVRVRIEPTTGSATPTR